MNKQTIKKSVLALAATSLMAVGASSCTGDFEDINRNPLLPTTELLNQDGVLNSAFMPQLQFAPVWTGLNGTDFVNNYQIADNLTVQSWMGYLAPRDAKWTNRNLSQFFFDTGWTNGIFSTGLTSVFSPWISLKQLNYDVKNPNLEIWHIAQLSKIMGLHRTTDKYGAIPYFGVGSGSFTVAYDSQEEIYKSFFKEIEEAVNHLYTYSLGGVPVPKASDVVYEGDALKWARFGNSLMLRLAMRIRYVDPASSKKWAEQAVNHPAGVMAELSDMAYISNKAGFTTKNSLFTIAGSYDDTRMGASIQSFLKGYEDPRLGVYFTGNTNIAVPPAIPSTGDTYNEAAKPNVGEFSPTIWMKPSEVAFLKAEAALAGYAVSGTAQAFYNEGIRLSFLENGLTEAQARTYQTSTRLPAAFQDIASKYGASAKSTVTVRWDDAQGEEVKLEKIITQKYLAIYPDGMEAWSEWRRTGYPRLLPANSNISNFGVATSDGHKDGVRSIPYPQKEITENATNVQNAIVKYRGGANAASVNVWWDVKAK